MRLPKSFNKLREHSSSKYITPILLISQVKCWSISKHCQICKVNNLSLCPASSNFQSRNQQYIKSYHIYQAITFIIQKYYKLQVLTTKRTTFFHSSSSFGASWHDFSHELYSTGSQLDPSPLLFEKTEM